MMNNEYNNEYDMIIIGGGPIGMFTAYYAKLRTLKVLLIESLGELGGQLKTLYPEKIMINVPGFPKIKANEFIEKLKNQLDETSARVILKNRVENIIKENEIFKITTDKSSFYGRTVVITTGIGQFYPRKLAINIDNELEKKYLSYYVSDPNKYKNLDIAIAGGGDTAIDTAIQLKDSANKIDLIHRRTEFRALERNMEIIENDKDIKLDTPFLIKELKEKSSKLEIFLEKTTNHEIKEKIIVDKLIVNYGFLANNKFQKTWDLDLERNLIKVNEKMETSRNGIYAAGDSVIYPNKERILASGFGEIPTIVNSAIRKFKLTNNKNIHGIKQ